MSGWFPALVGIFLLTGTTLHTGYPRSHFAIMATDGSDDGFGAEGSEAGSDAANHSLPIKASAAEAPAVSSSSSTSSAPFSRLMSVALAAHPEFRPAFPWEIGSMRDVFNCAPAPPAWQASGPIPGMPPRPAAAEPSKALPAVYWQLAKRRVGTTCWEEHEDAARHKALWKWRAIIFDAFESCRAGEQLFEACLAPHPDVAARLLLQDLFSGKANGTPQ